MDERAGGRRVKGIIHAVSLTALVALTDRLTSPLARSADAVLTVPEVDFGAFRSLSATLALALTLAVAVGARRDETA